MKAFALIPLTICLGFTACEKQEERMLIEETRRVTSKDTKPKLFATSDERFRDAKPSPFKGDAPENWLTLPSSQMRILNYRFGESGMGEVYLSVSGGGVPDNVNRWLKQFGSKPLSPADFSALEKVEVVGTEGVWVEMAGRFDAGPMGGAARSGFALAGVVADVGGRILTIKMIGPKPEVEAEKEELRQYIGSLQVTGN